MKTCLAVCVSGLLLCGLALLPAQAEEKAEPKSKKTATKKETITPQELFKWRRSWERKIVEAKKTGNDLEYQDVLAKREADYVRMDGATVEGDAVFLSLKVKNILGDKRQRVDITILVEGGAKGPDEPKVYASDRGWMTVFPGDDNDPMLRKLKSRTKVWLSGTLLTKPKPDPALKEAQDLFRLESEWSPESWRIVSAKLFLSRPEKKKKE